jgi:hypothetical protein|nr:MAG TPA: hypothetical protein [Caudoviricetes sp.]
MGDLLAILFAIITAVAFAAGLYYLIFGKLISGLMGFSSVAREWKSEDKQKVNLMRSLGFVAGGLVNLLIFLTIALVIGVIVAIIPK